MTLVPAIWTLDWVVPDYFDYVISGFVSHIYCAEDLVVQFDICVSHQETSLPPCIQSGGPTPDTGVVLVWEELFLDARVVAAVPLDPAHQISQLICVKTLLISQVPAQGLLRVFGLAAWLLVWISKGAKALAFWGLPEQLVESMIILQLATEPFCLGYSELVLQRAERTDRKELLLY